MENTDKSISVSDAKKIIAEATLDDFDDVILRFADDDRKGVVSAIESARKRMSKQRAERCRIEKMYEYDAEAAAGKESRIVIGCDEVGRGPLAGPLTVAAVALDPTSERIDHLNDSKQVSEANRKIVADKARGASFMLRRAR